MGAFVVAANLWIVNVLRNNPRSKIERGLLYIWLIINQLAATAAAGRGRD